MPLSIMVNHSVVAGVLLVVIERILHCLLLRLPKRPLPHAGVPTGRLVGADREPAEIRIAIHLSRLALQFDGALGIGLATRNHKQCREDTKAQKYFFMHKFSAVDFAEH